MSMPPLAEVDLAYQAQILQRVSRTFALTIPQLPNELCTVVSNAYLLCRIADTIEDDPGLDAEQTRAFTQQFIDVLAGQVSAETFAQSLLPRLTGKTLDAEKDLILNTPRVIRLTHGFRETQRASLERCVRIMSRGMAEFQEGDNVAGLATLPDLDRYCYHVAGVVGEMLTELFCDYSQEIDQHREPLLKLAVSFGQGLQMTNILKDIWEDRVRGTCWLPRDVFMSKGFDLSDLVPNGHSDPGFQTGLVELIGIARMHLENALRYTLLMPARETGIRKFCLWALGMAVLTLRKIYRHIDFAHSSDVKISRNSVKATVLVTSVTARVNPALRLLFDYFTRTLPLPNPAKASG